MAAAVSQIDWKRFLCVVLVNFGKEPDKMDEDTLSYFYKLAFLLYSPQHMCWWKHTSRSAPESGKNGGLSVFEAKRGILKGINSSVSYCNDLLNLNVHCLLQSPL